MAFFRRKWTSIILLVIWMVVIFVFSSKPGEESAKQSELVINFFRFIGIDLNQYFGELATFLVRKTAHFTEYSILYLLTYNMLRCYEDVKSSLVQSILITFGYACTDEVHQLFVPGRSGAFRDVLIDTSGGIFISFIIWYVIQKKNK